MAPTSSPGEQAVTTTELSQAVEPEALLELLKRFGFTNEDIAQATGAHARSVRRWKTAVPGSTPAVRLGEMRNVILGFRESEGLTDRGVVYWMRHPNRLLDDFSPLAVLGAGGFRLVREAAMCFIDTERAFQPTLPASILTRLRQAEVGAEAPRRKQRSSAKLSAV